MQEIQNIVLTSVASVLAILSGIAVKAVKDFLIAKGGEKSIKIVEILAKNAVNAVEQVSKETGYKGLKNTISICLRKTLTCTLSQR